jgi:hypothetical protein
LVELLKGDYASATVMPTKKDIFSNWTKWCVCGDYCPINKCTHSNKYAMPLLNEIFDALGRTKVFSALELKSNYHQLPLREGNKVKMTFWGIDPHGKDCLYQWWFLPFGLKNALSEF